MPAAQRPHSTLDVDGEQHARCNSNRCQARRAREIGGRSAVDLSRVYASLPVGLCHLDADLRYTHINQWLAAINGRSVEEHIGRTIAEVLPDVSKGVELLLRRVIETGEPLLGGTVEAETPAQPGVKRVFQHSYFPVESEDGAVIGVSCVVQDITKRKRAEEDLRKSEERYRTLVETIPHGIAEMDTSGVIIVANSAYHKLFGYGAGELIGTCFLDLIASDAEREAARDFLTHAVKQQPPPTFYTGQRRTRDRLAFR